MVEPVQLSDIAMSNSSCSAIVKASPMVELSLPPKQPEDMYDVVKHLIFKK